MRVYLHNFGEIEQFTFKYDVIENATQTTEVEKPRRGGGGVLL